MWFKETATTEIYTLSLHDALPIYPAFINDTVYLLSTFVFVLVNHQLGTTASGWLTKDRKSTRLNSSHTVISYAVFCLKKKKK